MRGWNPEFVDWLAEHAAEVAGNAPTEADDLSCSVSREAERYSADAIYRQFRQAYEVATDETSKATPETLREWAIDQVMLGPMLRHLGLAGRMEATAEWEALRDLAQALRGAHLDAPSPAVAA